jgi:hypothetical protein
MGLARHLQINAMNNIATKVHWTPATWQKNFQQLSEQVLRGLPAAWGDARPQRGPYLPILSIIKPVKFDGTMMVCTLPFLTPSEMLSMAWACM